MLFDAGDSLIRFFVSPDGVLRFRSTDRNAVVGTITLVQTIAVMRRANEQRHVSILARQVINRGISLLLQSKRFRRFGDYPPGNRHAHLALSRRNCDGMVGSRHSD